MYRAPSGKNPQDSEVKRIYPWFFASTPPTYLALNGSQKSGSIGWLINLPAEWSLELLAAFCIKYCSGITSCCPFHQYTLNYTRNPIYRGASSSHGRGFGRLCWANDSFSIACSATVSNLSFLIATRIMRDTKRSSKAPNLTWMHGWSKSLVIDPRCRRGGGGAGRACQGSKMAKRVVDGWGGGGGRACEEEAAAEVKWRCFRALLHAFRSKYRSSGSQPAEQKPRPWYIPWLQRRHQRDISRQENKKKWRGFQ